MTTHTLIVDALALLAMVAGFLIAFRQSWVRRLVRRLSGRSSARPAEGAPGEDPLHYAMIIAGVMLMAFGLLMFAFTTSFALFAA